jgi:hypothetical protein
MEGRRSSISAIGTMQVSAMRFRSTHPKTLSASPVGGPPAAAGPSTTFGPAFSQGGR